MIEIIIDASHSVLGRVASFAAKQSLLGKKVIIVNCGDAILTGHRNSIIKEYRIIPEKGGSSRRGPFFPKQPERIMRRTVRGMLSSHQHRGRSAFRRILCFRNMPKEYELSQKIALMVKDVSSSITLSALSMEI